MRRIRPTAGSASLSAYALAGSEENGRGHLVVTAPTGGSAGVMPALVYGLGEGGRKLPPEKIREGMLAAAAIGYLCKHNATLSAAEGGCQAEIGVASAMAAALVATAHDAESAGGRECRRVGARTSSGHDLRPGRRVRADPVHRALRIRRRQGLDRLRHRQQRDRIQPSRQSRRDHHGDGADRQGHEQQVQGNERGRTGSFGDSQTESNVEFIKTLLEQQPLMALFLTIAIGYLVGEINIKGFSLGVGAVLFVALAMGWFAPKSVPAPMVGTLGLALFLYAVGMQYGKQFFLGLTSAAGLKANLMALVGVLLAGAVSLLFVKAMRLEPRLRARPVRGIGHQHADAAGGHRDARQRRSRRSATRSPTRSAWPGRSCCSTSPS